MFSILPSSYFGQYLAVIGLEPANKSQIDLTQPLCSEHIYFAGDNLAQFSTGNTAHCETPLICLEHPV